MKNLEYVVPALLICMSVAGFCVFAYVATDRPLTDLESVFLQAFSGLTGFLGTFLIGRQSARSAAAEFIKPHARSAFRRLLSHYQSLHRMVTIIDLSKSSKMLDQYKEALARLEEIATTQISTADDALADWEDIVPEDIEELRKKLVSRSEQGGRP